MSTTSGANEIPSSAERSRRSWRDREECEKKREREREIRNSCCEQWTRRYDKRLSRFVAFQQTRHEGETKQGMKGRIFPLTSPYLGQTRLAVASYSFYFVREITARRCRNCAGKVLICGSRPRPARYRPAFVWISLNFLSRNARGASEEISRWWKIP